MTKLYCISIGGHLLTDSFKASDKVLCTGDLAGAFKSSSLSVVTEVCNVVNSVFPDVDAEVCCLLPIPLAFAEQFRHDMIGLYEFRIHF